MRVVTPVRVAALCCTAPLYRCCSLRAPVQPRPRPRPPGLVSDLVPGPLSHLLAPLGVPGPFCAVPMPATSSPRGCGLFEWRGLGKQAWVCLLPPRAPAPQTAELGRGAGRGGLFLCRAPGEKSPSSRRQCRLPASRRVCGSCTDLSRGPVCADAGRCSQGVPLGPGRRSRRHGGSFLSLWARSVFRCRRPLSHLAPTHSLCTRVSPLLPLVHQRWGARALFPLLLLLPMLWKSPGVSL